MPVFNEAPGLGEFLAEIDAAVAQCDVTTEYVLVDDGSVDASFQVVTSLAQSRGDVVGIQFTRNFGKEAALHAGLAAAQGDLIITMDADGQHPPQIIPGMVDAWRRGRLVVHAVKSGDSYQTNWHRIRARLFNATLSFLGDLDTLGASDFKLLDRRVVDTLVSGLPEHRRFFRGLAAWTGFDSESIPFTVRHRHHGQSKWTSVNLLRMAGAALISFTSAPLRVVSVLGAVTLIFGLVVSVEALWSWFRGESVSGFVTLIISMLLIGSFIMISLGIIGEYIAKIYEEVKQRPTYVVNKAVGPTHGDKNPSTVNHTKDSP